jgi:DNA-binding GntR family transcriptional regulator
MHPADPAGQLFAPSLVEVATARLRDEILSGHLRPGDRLIEEQIRQRFSISRAPLREAMRMLAEQGLIEHLPRRGARVTEWSDTDVRQLFGLRRLLERYAVAQAFPLPEPVDGRLAGVRTQLERMQLAHDRGDELAKDDAHRAFHAAVVALAGDPQLDRAIEPVLLKLQRPMAQNLRREAALAGPGEGLRRHRVLLDTLAGNDRDQVLAALDEHGTHRFLPAASGIDPDTDAIRLASDVALADALVDR